MANQIPIVDFLVLGDQPHLTAHECTSCRARFFDRRNASGVHILEKAAV